MKNTLFAFFINLIIVGSEGSPKPFEGVDTTPMKDAIKTAIEWSKLQDRDGVTYLPNTDKPFSGYAKRAYVKRAHVKRRDENKQLEILALFKDGYVIRVKQWKKNGTPRWDVGFMERKVGVEGMPYKGIPKFKEFVHGHSISWYENGKKGWEGIFKDGKEDGLQTEWYENGQKMHEITSKDGQLEGLSTVWYKNGQKMSEQSVDRDTEWYENGQKKLEGSFDLTTGFVLTTEWYENGQIHKVLNYKDRKLMFAEVWKPDGEKCPNTNLKDGNGVLVSYKDDGTVNSRTTYMDGRKAKD